jgi:hypothetical protein
MIKNTKRNDLSLLHSSLGVLIRDEFGLLKGNDELITAALEIDPNLATMTIIVEYWMYLKRPAEIRFH